jgi:hypothetical protein
MHVVLAGVSELRCVLAVLGRQLALVKVGSGRLFEQTRVGLGFAVLVGHGHSVLVVFGLRR